MATPNYDVNYDDKRFTEVETDKKAALAEVDQTYDGMISQTDQFYNQQIAAANNYAAQQKKIQQEQTDFAIEQINQQKEQATKDYQKEQSGAYVDWQKQSNQYGANAEAMAAQGMTNTGWSESSQVSMYNTYQNRVATAREAYSRAILNYDNAIKDARLQNNAALAEIAYNALQTQLELSLEGFQYKNTLVLAKADKKSELDNTYYSRYQDVLKQINTENALAEEVRQYDLNLKEEQRQFDAQMTETKRQFDIENDDDTPVVSTPKKGNSRWKSSSEKKDWTKSYEYANSAKVSMDRITEKLNNSKTMASIKNLGLGDLTAEQLNRYISMGYVIEYNNNGVLTYKLSPKGQKQKRMYESRT